MSSIGDKHKQNSLNDHVKFNGNYDISGDMASCQHHICTRRKYRFFQVVPIAVLSLPSITRSGKTDTLLRRNQFVLSPQPANDHNVYNVFRKILNLLTSHCGHFIADPFRIIFSMYFCDCSIVPELISSNWPHVRPV